MTDTEQAYDSGEIEESACGTRPYGLWLAGVLVLLAVVRLIALYASRTDLFFDEAQYWAWSRDLAWGYYSKPPLIAWIIRASTELCGNGEACVRAASPLIHSATAAVIFLIGRTLFDARIGFFSGVIYATLPAVSLSSGLISTDVPLLLFWALALFALIKLIETRALGWSVALGLALGLGMMAKYAMSFFALGLVAYLVLSPRARDLLRDPRSLVAVALAALIIAPNIWWNLINGMATFSHTADNANWHGSLIHPGKALDFFGAQFGVFGPILFAVLLWVLWRGLRGGWPVTDERIRDSYRFLLSFSVPILALITFQALISRAHANWAATAYVGASVAVAAALIGNHAQRLTGQRPGRRLFNISLALHLGVALLIAVGGMLAGRVSLPGGANPYARVLGWHAAAGEIEAEARAAKARSVMSDQRDLTAELIYYLRGSGLNITSWYAGGRPHDHFQLTRPISTATPGPILFVTRTPDPQSVTVHFASVRRLGSHALSAGKRRPQKYYFFVLEGFNSQH